MWDLHYLKFPIHQITKAQLRSDNHGAFEDPGAGEQVT